MHGQTEIDTLASVPIHRSFFLEEKKRHSPQRPHIYEEADEGGVEWFTCNIMLGWEKYIVAHILRLPSTQTAKVGYALYSIPATAYQCSFWKWSHLPGLLQRITPIVARSQGMFTCIQHALTLMIGQWIDLSEAVQDKLFLWWQIVRSLSQRPTHLHKLKPFLPTWVGATDILGTRMGGVCRNPYGK